MIVLLPLLLTSVDVGGVVHRARSAVEFEKEVAEARAATARHEPQLALELWQRLAQRVSWHSERDDVGMRQYADVLRGLAAALRVMKLHDREVRALRGLLVAQGRLGVLPETYLVTFTQLIMALNRGRRHHEAVITAVEAKRAIGSHLQRDGLALLQSLTAHSLDCNGEHESALQIMETAREPSSSDGNDEREAGAPHVVVFCHA